MFAAAALLAPRAAALLDFNDGRDHVALKAAYGIVYDSNVFVHAGGEGDTSQTLSLAADYTRRAGLIGVDASVSVAAGRYASLTSRGFHEPVVHARPHQGPGPAHRLGDASVQRESRSDPAANVRATSWNYGSTLQRPLSGQRPLLLHELHRVQSPRLRRQRRAVRPPVVSRKSIDVYYVYTSKLDFLGGYRVRQGNADGGSHTLDQAVTLGATGSILPKLTGSLRLGYQWRDEAGGGSADRRYDALTSNLSLGWPVTSG